MYKRRYDDDYACMSDAYYEDFSQSDTCDCCLDASCKPYPSYGITGPMGPRGPKGDQGPRGLQGIQGKEGLQGLRGPQGNTGPQGVPGLQGPAGATGPRGIQGMQGATGEQGERGVAGPMGSTGPTGPAGKDAAPIMYAAAAMTSYLEKNVCPGDALMFDSANLPSGFEIREDYKHLVVLQEGTYIIDYGCFVQQAGCMGDAIAVEINNEAILDESRIPIVCDHTFVKGCVLVHLNPNDTLCLIADTHENVMVCNMDNCVNAYLTIHQIN